MQARTKRSPETRVETLERATAELRVDRTLQTGPTPPHHLQDPPENPMEWLCREALVFDTAVRRTLPDPKQDPEPRA